MQRKILIQKVTIKKMDLYIHNNEKMIIQNLTSTFTVNRVMITKNGVVIEKMKKIKNERKI